jgi:hypothetical protein
VSGKVFASFNKWRTIPEANTDNDALAAGSAFEKKIFFFFARKMRRSTFSPLYNILLDG